MRVVFSVFIFALIGISAIAKTSGGTSAVDDGAGQVFLLARNAAGGSVVQTLPADEFKHTVTGVFSSISSSLIPVLSAPSRQPTGTPTLELRTVAVGVALSGQLGLGPIFQITITPSLKLVFSNAKTPVYPD